MNEKTVSRDELCNKIEPFIHQNLAKKQYQIFSTAASKLLTSKRFDINLKLAYLSLKDRLPDLARRVYFEDIRAQTLGKFIEYGNEEKDSFATYIEHFSQTYQDIQATGFDAQRTLVPLSNNNSILNGAHRVACAIHLNQNVTCVPTELDDVSPDYKYFLERNVPESILDIGAITHCDYSDKAYLAFLWPSGRTHHNESATLFNNVVYRKNIQLTPEGSFNLLTELYKHMDWIGSPDDSFSGLQRKRIECFTDYSPFTVILFQSENLESVQKLKQAVRDINKIGFSSVHITDTKEEAARLARLLFNRNGLHFLNQAQPGKFLSTQKMVEHCKSVLTPAERSNLVLCGSMTLTIYGMREARDIDFISTVDIKPPQGNYKMGPHDTELPHHKLEKEELVHNPNYHFEYCGLKFTSFEQTFIFKKNRAEKKDAIDCKIMESFIENNKCTLRKAIIQQRLFYIKLVAIDRARPMIFRALKATGTYNLIRSVYRLAKKAKSHR